MTGQPLADSDPQFRLGVAQAPGASLQLECLFLDDRNEHRTSNLLPQITVIVPDKSARACDFLTIARDLRRNACRADNSACRHDRQIVVKSACILKHPASQMRAITYEEILTHQANTPADVCFMESHLPVAQYIESQAIANIVTVVLECTFDGPTCAGTLKRTAEPDAMGSNKRQKLPRHPEPQPGILYIPATADANTLIDLLPPFFCFPDYRNFTGVIMADKSRFILPVVKLLEGRGFYSLVLPSGAGKTTFIGMAKTWLDCKISPPEATAIFGNLDIMKDPKMQEHVLRGRGEYLCLSFDFANVTELRWDGFSSEEELKNRIEVHLCETMQHFAVKYQVELGGMMNWDGGASSELILTRILALIRLRQLKILIVMDHVDAPILALLPTLTSDDVMQPCATLIHRIAKFLNSQEAAANVTLLVAGRIPIPLINNIPLVGNRKFKFQEISLRQTLKGAFGVTTPELEGIYATLRTFKPDLQVVKNRRAEFGYFIPRPPQTIGDSHSLDEDPGFYSFNVILRHFARIVHLNKEHRVWKPVLLELISQHCERLLTWSSLRFGREVTVAPFQEISVKSFAMFLKREEALWKLLYFLGALSVRAEKEGGDAIWHLRISGIGAKVALFHGLPNPKDLNGSKHEEILRALLEHSPQSFTHDLSTIIARIPLLDMDRVNEAVFQTILDTFMYSRDSQGKIPYLQNYFSQLGLITAETPREPQQESEGSFKASGKLPATSSSKGGDGQKAKVSSSSSGKRLGASSSRLQAPRPQLEASSSKLAGHGNYGYADGAIFNLACHPGRVVVIELKYIPLSALFRGKDDDRYSEALKRDRSEFRRLCIEEIALVEKMSLEELLKLRFHYRDEGAGETITIRALVEKAKLQIIQYMNAILRGALTPVEHAARIHCTPTHDSKEVDEVVGFVVIGVGRRVFSVQVEPTFDPKELPANVVGFSFKAWQNWLERFEKNPKYYGKQSK